MTKDKKYINLHIHTNASDGDYSARDIVKLAKKEGLHAIAITDHDSISNVKAAIREGKRYGIEVLPGIEFTVDDEKHKIDDIHIIGLFLDVGNKYLRDVIKSSSIQRLNQKKKIIKKLRKLGYNINFEDVRKLAKGELSRLHIAKALLEKNKEFKDIEQIFDKLIGIGKAAYAERKNKLGIKKAVSAIHKANGIAILAHPYLYNINLNHLIDIFIKEGGDGLEVYYPYYATKKFRHKTKRKLNDMQSKLEHIAIKKGLIMSGGTDFHGHDTYTILGKFKIPYSILETMKFHHSIEWWNELCSSVGNRKAISEQIGNS